MKEMAENNRIITEKVKRKRKKISPIDGKMKIRSKYNNNEHKDKRKKRKTTANAFNVTQINDLIINSEKINDNIEVEVINNSINNNNDVINSESDYFSGNSMDLNHKINDNNSKQNNKDVNVSQISSEKNKNHLSHAELHQRFPSLRGLTKEEKSNASEAGLVIKSGKYSKEEDDILRKNWEQFCNDYIVDIPHLVLGYFRYCKDVNPEDKADSRKLVKESALYLRLAKGLPNRTLYSVYSRARKLFSGLNKSDNISPEERKQILELHQKFRNQFSMIAEKLLCDIKTVREVIRTTIKPNGTKLKHGLWDEMEENDLINAIKTVLKTDNLKNCYQNIPWALVAIKMHNRNEVQCRQHFYSCICWKVLHPECQQINRWNSKSDNSKLIYFLYRNDYENENQIEWDLLKEKFQDVVVFNKLSRNWYNLKTSVPDYHSKSFKQIVLWLYENKLKNQIQTQSDWESLEEFCLT